MHTFAFTSTVHSTEVHYYISLVGSLTWCTDSSDLRQFGPKTLRHHRDGSELSGQIGTSAEFGTGATLSAVKPLFIVCTE